jgi:hypothetical protein
METHDAQDCHGSQTVDVGTVGKFVHALDVAGKRERLGNRACVPHSPNLGLPTRHDCSSRATASIAEGAIAGIGASHGRTGNTARNQQERNVAQYIGYFWNSSPIREASCARLRDVSAPPRHSAGETLIIQSFKSP